MIRVLFSAGTAAAANGITADVDVLLDAGGAGSAGDDFTVNLTLDEGSASIQLMPPSVNLVITGIAPLVSAGVGISLPAAAYSIAGLAPAVRSVLAVRVPLGEFELVPAAPTIATGASVSPAALALGISAVAPEAVGPPTGDPDFASVSLLLPFDGADGSTTFTDESSNALIVTANGDAQISTAQSKFGGSSLLLDGNGDYLSIADNALLELGSGDFTIELQLYIASDASNEKAIAQKGAWPTGGVTASWLIYFGGLNELSFYASSGGTSWNIASDRRFATGIARASWHHIAVTRSGTTFRGFFNGVTAFTFTSSAALFDSSSGLTIGSGNAGSNAIKGHIDDLRITKGVARYTANFTPPTEPFPTS
jgi:hypothetical protein